MIMKSIQKHAFMAQVANSIILLSFSVCTCHLPSLVSFFCKFFVFVVLLFISKKILNCFSNLGLITDITPNLTVFNSTGFPPISVKTFGAHPLPLFLCDEICKFALSEAKCINFPCRCFAFRNALVFYFLP